MSGQTGDQEIISCSGRSGNFKVQRLLSFPGVYCFLLKKLIKQKRFLKKEIQNELEIYRKEADGSLLAPDFKKITSYYALGVPGILGELFCCLHGNSFSTKERFCLTYLGGISGLLDDLFDVPGNKTDHLKNFILDPETVTPSNTYETLLLQFYLRGLSFSNNRQLIINQALQVFESQQESLQQQKDLTLGQIKEITYSKGGSSFVFYRLCLNLPMDPAERKFIFQLGNVMQLGNDIFDIWEDTNSGTNTAATKTTDILKLRNMFTRELEKTYSLARKTSFPAHRINRFLQFMDLALARVYVCLDQFYRLQQQSGGNIIVSNYSRKELICDMEKPANLLKAFKYYVWPVTSIR